jgi:integrase
MMRVGVGTTDGHDVSGGRWGRANVIFAENITLAREDWRMKGCQPLTEEEVTLVHQSFGGVYADRDKALFLLGVTSGFRISELLSLRVGDVWVHGRLVDRVTVPRCHMKGKQESRTVLLHPDAKAALAPWLFSLRQLPGVDPQTFVFRSRKGPNRAISPVQAWRLLHEAVTTNELAGKLGTHTMRKTFANRIYERSGRDLIATQQAMGHKHVNSTQQSLSFRQEDIDALILAI